MVICELCENMDCHENGIGCMVRSRKRDLNGKWCGDFAPNELFIGVSVRLLKMIFRKVDKDGKE